MSDRVRKPKQTRAPRRPAQFWSPLNNWWRRYLADKGQRPVTSQVQQWFDEHATSVWDDADRPTWKETRIHAKCLRSTEQVKNYFREYRARGKGEEPLLSHRSLKVKDEPRQAHEGDLGCLIASHNARISGQGAPAGGGGNSMAESPPSPSLTDSEAEMEQRQSSHPGESESTGRLFPNNPSRLSPFRVSSFTGMPVPSFPSFPTAIITSGGTGGGRAGSASAAWGPHLLDELGHGYSCGVLPKFAVGSIYEPSAAAECERSSKSFTGPGMVDGLRFDTMAGSGDNKRRHTVYDTYAPAIPANEGCLQLTHSLPVQPGWLHQQQQQQQPAWNHQNAALEALAARSASVGGRGAPPQQAAMGQVVGWVEGLKEEPQLNRSQSSCSPYGHQLGMHQGDNATRLPQPRQYSGAISPSAAGPVAGLLTTRSGSWPRQNVPGLWALAEHAPQLQHQGQNLAGSTNAAALQMQWSQQQQQSEHDTCQQGLRTAAVMQASRFSRGSSASQQQQQQQPPQAQNLALPRWSSEEIQCQLQLRPASEQGRGPTSGILGQAATAVTARNNAMHQPQQATTPGFTFGAQPSASLQGTCGSRPQLHPDPLQGFHLDLANNGASSNSLGPQSYPHSSQSAKPDYTDLNLSPALRRMQVNSGVMQPVGSHDMALLAEQRRQWSHEQALQQQQQQQLALNHHQQQQQLPPPQQPIGQQPQQELSWLQQAWLQEEQHDLPQQHTPQGAVAPPPSWAQQGADVAIKIEAPLSTDSAATSCTSDSGSPRHSGQMGIAAPAYTGGNGLGLPVDHLDQRAVSMAGQSGSGLPSAHGCPAPEGMRERFVSDGFREQAAAAMAGIEWEHQDEEGLLSTPSWLLGELLEVGGPNELKYIR